MVPPKFTRNQLNARFKAKHKKYEPYSKEMNNSSDAEKDDSSQKEAKKCEKRHYGRLPSEVYDLGLNGSDLPPSYLRPIRTKVDATESNALDEYIMGNRIVSMPMMAEIMSDVFVEHSKKYPKCRAPKFHFPASTELCQGLGASVEVVCTNPKCGFVLSRRPLSPQIKRNISGPRPFVVNAGLGQFMAQSETALNSIAKLFPHLNVRCPNEKTVLHHINNACKVNTELSEVQLAENREALRMIVDHMDEDSDKKIIVAGDTVYNNASKGANRVPGTQSSTPFIEMTTKKNLILGIEVHTQICNKCGLGLKAGAFHKGCLRNYPSPGPMSEVEKRASNDFYNKIENSPLKGKITHHLSDQCKQIQTKAGIEKIVCIQHLKRSHRRKFWRAIPELSSSLFGSGTIANRNKNVMSHVVVNRCSMELTKARKMFPNDDEKFYELAQKMRFNIVKCLGGFHEKCNKASLVCRPKRDLICKDQYELSAKDLIVLQEVIDYR